MPTKAIQYPNLLNLTPLAASGNSNPINLPPTSFVSYGVTIYIKFTVGSLTNATFVPQILNPDGSTWCDYYVANAVNGTGTVTVSTNASLTVHVYGAKQMRVRYTTTGTVTSSAAVIDATGYQIF